MKKTVIISIGSSIIVSAVAFAFAQEATLYGRAEGNDDRETSVRGEARVNISPAEMQARMLEEKKRFQAEARNSINDLREEKAQVLDDIRSTGKSAVEEMRNERQSAVRSMMGNNSDENRKDVEMRFRTKGESRSGENASTSVGFGAEMREDMEMRREEMKKEFEERREEMEMRREEMKKEFEERREEMKMEMEAKQAEFKLRIENKKEEMRQEFEERKAELKEKLSVIKDERKVSLTLNINEKFQALNKKVVDSLTEAVNRKEEVVNKLKERVVGMVLEGKDVTEINSQISIIEGKIAEARSMIIAQSSKVYTIDVTNEAELKGNVGETNTKLRADVTVIHDFTKSISDLIRIAVEASNK